MFNLRKEVASYALENPATGTETVCVQVQVSDAVVGLFGWSRAQGFRKHLKSKGLDSKVLGARHALK